MTWDENQDVTMRECFPLPPVGRPSSGLGAKIIHFGGRLLRTLRPSRERELLLMAWQGRRIYARARRYGLRGEAFHRFGRSLGWRLWLRDHQDAAPLLRRPVGSTRYFEFDFAWRALQGDGFSPTEGLDVSSPFLFSLYAVSHIPRLSLHMLNPNPHDLHHSMRIARALRWRPIKPVMGGVEALDEVERKFDALWSISVIEHIVEDTKAVQRMWNILRPGGRLILTVPTDKRAWDEYRDQDPYGTQPQKGPDGLFFFQRFYDENALRDRIIAAVGVQPARMEWFGEKVAGHFHDYIARWRREGGRLTLMDPLDIARNYRAYASFDEMPGAGVCGLLFIKPGGDTPINYDQVEDSEK